MAATSFWFTNGTFLLNYTIRLQVQGAKGAMKNIFIWLQKIYTEVGCFSNIYIIYIIKAKKKISLHVRSQGLEITTLIRGKIERYTPLIVIGPDYNGLD